MGFELELHYPKVTVSSEKIDKDTGIIDTAQAQVELENIPRRYMDVIEEVLGNGQARVTVSVDYGIKDYGTGTSAMASVSLPCNNDIKTVERAAQIAGELARDIAQETRQRAEIELQQIITDRAPTGPSYGSGR